MKAEIQKWNFDSKPLLVFWETTKACPLSCLHCRAEAIRDSLPGELTTSEGMELIDQVAEFDEPRPALILTGGDILMRKDIFLQIEYATKKGLRVAVAPSVTPLLTHEVLSVFRDRGVNAISISLDGAKPETHDRIRGVPGTFEASIRALKAAIRLGLRVQVNTTIMKGNYQEMAELFHLIRLLKVPAWEVFFLIRTGRGAELEDLEPYEYEEMMHFLYDASYYGVTIRTTEAPQFRRIVTQRSTGVVSSRNGRIHRELVRRLKEFEGLGTSDLKALTTSTRDGKGVIFVAHNGEIFPSGFLPMSLGNVIEDRLKQVYQNNQILQALRNENNFKGKCGMCEYRKLCGGSRSRAYAHYHDPFQEDPACIYQPKMTRSELEISTSFALQ